MNSVELARKLRIHTVEMAHLSGSSHVASALSICDIIAVLYTDILKYKTDDPKWDERDRLILSKGHACAPLYAALAEVGFFSINELATQCKNNSRLSGHISHINVPGVEVSTGSLGHGCCIAAGMALYGILKRKQYRVFTIVGDGECDEGSVWEMALFAHQHKLSNFTLIVDENKMQAMGNCSSVADHICLGSKWRDFGWVVCEINGHDCNEIKKTLQQKNNTDKPICVIAHTIKGKGVSFMENNLLWHYRDPQGELFEQAMKELNTL